MDPEFSYIVVAGRPLLLANYLGFGAQVIDRTAIGEIEVQVIIIPIEHGQWLVNRFYSGAYPVRRFHYIAEACVAYDEMISAHKPKGRVPQ